MKKYLMLSLILASVPALGAELSYTYDLQTSTQEMCGVVFSKIQGVDASGKVDVLSRSVQLTGALSGYRVSLPSAVQVLKLPEAYATAKGSVVMSKSGANINLGAPLLPDLPIFPDDSDRPFPVPRPKNYDPLCNYLKNYLTLYLSQSSLQIQSPFVTLTISKGGATTLRPKASIPSSLVNQPIPSVTSSQRSSSRGTVGGTLEHLIIYDPLYETEAFRLRDYRNTHGTVSYAIAVSSLPGYHSADPIPQQCLGPRYAECYFDPNTMTMDGVSNDAVPSLVGYNNDIPAGNAYARVSYIPGIIRAFLRDFKSKNPLKYVVLMGDPRLVPPFYTDSVSGGNAELLYSTPYGSEWFRSANAQPTISTDFWFANPDVPMVPLNQTNRMARTYFMFACQDGMGVIHYRTSCLVGEAQPISWTGDTSSLDWNLKYPTSPIFHDQTDYAELYNRSLDDILSIGRIHSEQYLDLPLQALGAITRHKDPGVNNYITKLKLWESAHVPLGNGKYFITAHTLFTGDSISNVSHSRLMSNIGVRNAPYYFSDNGDTTAQAFSDLSSGAEKFAWYIYGHGGHGGVAGPTVNFNIPTNPPASPSAQQQIVPGSNGTFYAGLVHANSCQLASYPQMTAASLADHETAGSTSLSFAEVLTTADQAGAGAGVHLNFDVGYSCGKDGCEDTYFNGFTQVLKATYNVCEPMGRVIARAQNYYTTSYSGTQTGSLNANYETKNKVYFGDPMASMFKGCGAPMWNGLPATQ